MGKEHVFDRIAMAVNDLLDSTRLKPVGIGMGLARHGKPGPKNGQKPTQSSRLESGECGR
jgi:hypothetical protein